MQIAILPMPPISGPTIDRRTNISVETLLRAVGPHIAPWNRSKNVLLGSHIVKAPAKLYKVFHVGRDNNWLFETVCSVEGNEHVCLYTKMIKDYTDIAISMKAISRYRDSRNTLYPLLDLVSKEYWRKSSSIVEHVIHSLIPPIFSQEAIDRTTLQLVDMIENGTENRAGWQLRPIYDNEPGVLEALISGTFIRPPSHELQILHPDVQIKADRWFGVDKIRHQRRATLGDIHINHWEFDTLALSLVGVRPSSLSLTALLSHAIDGILDLSITRHFEDPYLHFHPLTKVHMTSLKETLSKILYDAVMLYCYIYDINYACYLERKEDQSSISIEKNIYDEVIISIHDLIHDRYTCFYTYLPPLLLATMGVGEYVTER